MFGFHIEIQRKIMEKEAGEKLFMAKINKMFNGFMEFKHFTKLDLYIKNHLMKF